MTNMPFVMVRFRILEAVLKKMAMPIFLNSN
jgi:hypothetical protein